MNEENPRQIDDRRLLEAAARGETDAFEALYDRLSGPLYALCLRMTGDPAEAEDILQEACLTIWRRSTTYDAALSSVFSWAVHLTRCKAIDHLRSRGRRLRVLLPEDLSPGQGAANNNSGGGNGHGQGATGGARQAAAEAVASNGPAAGDVADQREQAGRVRRVLGELPAEQSQAIELAFFGDLTHHEISARLGQPLGTIKARIRRGLLKLRDELRGER